VAWSVTSTQNNVSLTDNGMTANLTVTDTNVGTATLTLTVDGTDTYTKTIDVNDCTIPNSSVFEIWIEEQYDQGNSVPMSGDTYLLCEGKTYAVYMDYLYEYAGEDIQSLEWSFDFDYTEGTQYTDYIYITIDDLENYYYEGEDNGFVAVNTSCNKFDDFITFECAPYSSCSSGYSMMMSPNPATNEAEATLTVYDIETGEALDEYEYAVYDVKQNLKLKKTKIQRLKDTKIKTNGWKAGSYYVVVYSDGIKKASILQVIAQ
jgi:hypothetical protein